MGKMITRFGMDITELREFCKNKTKTELCQIFNVSEKALISQLHYYGVGWKRVYTKDPEIDLRNDMIKTLSKTYSYGQIGSVLGISRQRVEQIVNS